MDRIKRILKDYDITISGKDSDIISNKNNAVISITGYKNSFTSITYYFNYYMLSIITDEQVDIFVKEKFIKVGIDITKDSLFNKSTFSDDINKQPVQKELGLYDKKKNIRNALKEKNLI